MGKKKKKSKSLWDRIKRNLSDPSSQKSFGTMLESFFKLNPEFQKLQKQKKADADMKRNQGKF